MKMIKLPVLSKDQIDGTTLWKSWIPNSHNWARLLGTNIIFCYSNCHAKRFYWLGSSDPTSDKSITDTPQMYFRNNELHNSSFLMANNYNYSDMLVKMPNHLSEMVVAGIVELQSLSK
jgi:hypothetical protein